MSWWPDGVQSWPRDEVFPEPESVRDLYVRQFKCSARFWKARVALYAILRAMGIGSGDSVLVPGYTCVVVPSAVKFIGARPIYVDIGENSYNIDLETIKEAYERPLPAGVRRPRALIIQHTYGIPIDVEPVLEFARANNLFVIEDCCHAIGSRVRFQNVQPGEQEWRYAGTLGDAAFFSSQWSKPVVSGVGGWAIAQRMSLQGELLSIEGSLADPDFMNVAKLGAQVAAYWLLVRPSLYWRAIELYRMLSKKGLVVSSSDSDEWHGEMPADYKRAMSFMQSKLILRGLEDVDEYIAHRRMLRRLYDEALAAEGLPALRDPEHIDSVLLRYPLRAPNKYQLIEDARHKSIELGDWFNHPLHPIGWELSALEWVEGQCPRSERAAAETINLPMHARIGEKEVRRTVEFLAQRLRDYQGVSHEDRQMVEAH